MGLLFMLVEKYSFKQNAQRLCEQVAAENVLWLM